MEASVKIEFHDLPRIVTYSNYATYTPSGIKPCSTTKDSAVEQPGLFHLLNCGHIVAIDETDRRCGRNCQQATEWMATNRLDLSAASNHFAYGFPPISPMQRQDALYCEICNGIPMDRYKAMHPPSNELFPNIYPVLRRCLALSRPLIAAATHLPDAGVESLLCGPLFSRHHQASDYNHTHMLQCGHEIWPELTRPCGYNCISDRPCRGGIFHQDEKRQDAIICQECVMRAELVYMRFERMDLAMKSIVHES